MIGSKASNEPKAPKEFRSTAAYLIAIAVLLAVAVALQMWRDRGWKPYEPATAVMWLRAGPAMKRAALGYDTLLADIYWIRAVVYFGQQRLSQAADKNYDLLYPMLELVTTLDPRFTIAYRFGAIFLAEPPPNGPGRPDQAVNLLLRGVEVSPERWEYPHAIGFTYFWSHRDYAKAADWIERASRVPGSPNWLLATAGLMRAEAGDRDSARILWRQLHDSSDDPSLRGNAQLRLAQFDAMDAMDALETVLKRYQERTGRTAATWQEVIAAGMLRRVPLDPTGVAFEIDAAKQEVYVAKKSPLWPMPSGFTAPAP